jgi:phosphate transport system permease protein
MPAPVPERFLVAKATLRFDRLMTFLIRFGGIAIVLAVFGMCLFILLEVIPLFRSARVTSVGTVPMATAPPDAAAASAGSRPQVIGLDEWSLLPFTYDGRDTVRLIDRAGKKPTVELKIELPEGATVTAWRYQAGDQKVLLGTSDGQVGSFTVNYSTEMDDTNTRQVSAEVEMGPFFPIGEPGRPIVDLDFGGAGEDQLFAAKQERDGRLELHALLLRQKRSLMGSGDLEEVARVDLTPQLKGQPTRLRVPRTGDAVIVSTTTHTVEYFFRDDDTLALRQEFTPMAGAAPAGEEIASMDFVFGDVSLVFTNPAGAMRLWSLNVPPGADQRVFVQTKEFDPLPAGAGYFVASQRNKSFLTGSGTHATLRHATTTATRWQSTLPFTPAAVAVDGKFEHVGFLDPQGDLHLYEIHDPHPEAGVAAFFRPVWYEGAPKPDYVWQSTSGNDEFEPKLSLIPLIFGTLKGTLWAMVFAVPVALLAAVYTAHFLPPDIKRVVKPAMEIMASLPSVVLGFLAALWLAPLLERRVPSVLLCAVGIPAVAMLAGWLWSRQPARRRSLLRPGLEWLAFLPVLIAATAVFWSLGPALDRAVFDGDFRQWWPRVTGTSFDQRNSLVVGFMMGFAVIPIIFTIAEDALSAVPPSLTAASAALGASRWQTVRTVVLPVASAGIFSALMVGLGRAVGETMIVVMATGNTPIMEWNLFNGMRTLSANIAVELPEAPVDSTHYRTLFLGALVLFALTFVLNTIAELLRQHLREKFKLV